MRETALRFITRAGPEIGVASTKAFTTQLTALFLLTLLLAYHVALVKGTDVDKPRNLAKSVTVE